MRSAGRIPFTQAFSLIELLIVVSILSILTLTLLPSLNQYYFRACLTKVYIDMKALGKGIYAYFADHGVYQPSGTLVGGEPMSDEAVCMLTTPIAYLASIPQYPWKNHMLPRHNCGIVHSCGNYYLWANDNGGFNSTVGAPDPLGWCIRIYRPYLVTEADGERSHRSYALCSDGNDSFADPSTWQWNDP